MGPGHHILGRGLAFPLHIDPHGGLALADDELDVEQAIGLILGTAPGERPMRPDFGCTLHDHVFDRIDARSLGRIDAAIRTALDRWEPRIEIEQIEFDTSGADEARLEIQLTYRLRATNAVRNLVYPFYLVPAEPLP
jgi:phage baseplate assembly protein W